MVKTLEQKSLKIGLFTDSYSPYISGVVRSVELLKEELEKKGHETFIFAPNYPRASKEKKVFRYLSLPAPTQRNFFLPIPFSPRLPYTMRSLGLDIIHVHTPFLLGSLGTLMAKRFNLPLIFTYHTLYHCYAHYLPAGKNLTLKVIENWNKNFCNSCDLIIAPSLYVKKLLRENGIRSPVDVIPTGLNNSFFSCNDDYNDASKWLKRKFNLNHGEKILLYVGRLGKEKNLIFLIEAVEQIIKYYPLARLLIVGTGPEEKNLKSLCHQKNLHTYILFGGQVNQEELLKCYTGADIFTFASQTETQGLVVGEAKAAGLPVISLFSPCLTEIVFNGKDGFLVGNLKDFVLKTVYLLENDTVAKTMGKRGKINAIRYSSDFLVKKMLNSYYNAIQRKKDP